MRGDFIRGMLADFIRSMHAARSMRADFIRSMHAARSMGADFIRSMRAARSMRSDFMRSMRADFVRIMCAVCLINARCFRGIL